MPSRTRALPAVAVALLVALAGCTVPEDPGIGAWNDCGLPEDMSTDECRQHSAWLADDLDLASYRVAGDLEGIRFEGDVCALNLMATFFLYRDGDPAGGFENVLLFSAGDQTLSGGRVDGGWLFSDDHFVILYEGSTYTRSGAEEPMDDGTLTLSLTIGEHLPDPSFAERRITAEFTATAIPTPQHCLDETDLEVLREERELLPPIGEWK